VTQPKWKVALFKRRREIQPKELIQFIWNLPATEFIEPPPPSSAPAEGKNASSGQAARAASEECNYLAEGSRVSAKLSFQGPARKFIAIPQVTAFMPQTGAFCASSA
jgi:hypothetical protein